MKRIQLRLATISGVLLITLATAAGAQESEGPAPLRPEQLSLQPSLQETTFEVSDRYTSQRRPRVTVLDFEDTNTEAQSARYGSSVEAMLVTFFKRKSQFVVVERQKLKGLLAEKQRIQNGMIQVDPDDPAARDLLEKIDAFVLGSVTLLNVEDSVKTAPRSAEKEEQGNPLDSVGPGEATQEEVHGPRIEIDAKLLSRFDGRIIAAAQRRGPVACLRSIVERLGIALEQEFLRPYYGMLTVNLDAPENVQIFLTPILLDSALDEEKPPVELGSTVLIGRDKDQDIVEPWATDPATYRIENLLSGWYSLRLERSGYDKIELPPGRWEARNLFGSVEIYDRVTGKPLSQTEPSLRRFVVHVEPQSKEALDLNGLKFAFHKKTGSLAPLVKRQYLDTDYSKRPQRVILMGGPQLEINRPGKPGDYADDKRCPLIHTKSLELNDYGRTYVAAGQQFDIDSFKGGELIIEDYQGEQVPVGKYRMVLWEPRYQRTEVEVQVRDQDLNKKTQTVLNRETMSVVLEMTGRRPANRAFLDGSETHRREPVPLDFVDSQEQPGLPVDVYTVSTDIPGLDNWRQTVELLTGSSTPPVYDVQSKRNEPELLPRLKDDAKPAASPRLTIKTRIGFAGRFEAFSRPPDPLAADAFLDRDVLKILNLLLYGQEERPQEEKGRFLKAVAQAGRSTIRVIGETAIAPPPAEDSSKANDGSSKPVENQPPPPPPLPSLPRDPDRLRELLARHLQLIDLLILDDKDMAQLRRSPEVAVIIERYVEAGGSLFAFVTEGGEYGPVVGAPLLIERLSKPTDRFEIAPGEVRGIVPVFDKKIDVKSKRELPDLAVPVGGSWRVLAFSQGNKRPRVIERGSYANGGYVALWFDDPVSFRGTFGGTVAEVEATRANMEEHVLEWARFLMYRRYDKSGEQRRRAEAQIAR